MFVRLSLILLALGLAHAQPAVEGSPVELASLRYIDIAQGAGAPAAAGKRFTTSCSSSFNSNQLLSTPS